MKHLTTIICLTLTLFLGSVENSKSADFQKGLTAALSGDFATALREWKPLAKQGNADAQYNLGYMYQKGLGVPQDDKTAVKWYTLAAERGNANARTNLSNLQKRMAKTRKTPTVTAKRTSPPSPSVGESSALPPCTGGNYSNCFGTHTIWQWKQIRW
jgi:TPR repeat protein